MIKIKKEIIINGNDIKMLRQICWAIDRRLDYPEEYKDRLFTDLKKKETERIKEILHAILSETDLVGI